MAGGHGCSSVTITLLQRDLLIQHKIDTWIWFHPVDPYKALMALQALLPSLVAYLPMNFDSKPSYKSMSAFQWRESRRKKPRAGRRCTRRETRKTHPARTEQRVAFLLSIVLSLHAVFLLNIHLQPWWPSEHALVAKCRVSPHLNLSLTSSIKYDKSEKLLGLCSKKQEDQAYNKQWRLLYKFMQTLLL